MITNVVRLSFPALFEPKANPSGKLKYGCSLIISKDDVAGVKALQDAVAKAILKGKEKLWSNKVPTFRYQPIRDGDAELESGDKTDPVYKNSFFINCAADTAPGIVQATATGPKPLLDVTAIFAGCWVRADVNAYPYKNSGNNGVGWGLNNVMLVKEGERLDGRMRATDAFANYDITEEEEKDGGAGTGDPGGDDML
jgi:hypothetical protein